MKTTILFFVTILFIGGAFAQEVTNGTFTDSRDGHTYKAIKIGTQTWMAENLAYKAGSGCWAYDANNSNVAEYGYLYNWETAKNVCPSGYHLPTKAEFETLLDNYGGGQNHNNANYQALIPGGTSGFSALLGGYRYFNGNFYDKANYGTFWSATAGNDDDARELDVTSNDEKAGMDYSLKSSGLSVRCVKDN